MSAVSNQSHYATLEPIPIPSERFLQLRNVIIRITLIVTVTSLFVFFGIGLSLSSFQFYALDSAIISGTIGFITSVVLAKLWHLPSPISEYRLSTLGQIEGILGSDRAKNTLRELKNFFSYPFTHFYQTFHNHSLHNLLYTVSEQIPSDRDDVKKIWGLFLSHLQRQNIRSADGDPIELNFTMETERLKGSKTLNVGIEKLSPWNPSYEEDLTQIEELQKISLGKAGFWPKERLKAKFAESSKNGCIVARRQDTKKVIGFAWYSEENGEVTLSGIAKDPGATGHLNIGPRLMYAFLEQITEGKKVKLQVRKSNPAINLYKGVGFEVVKELPQYYPMGPPEDALEMHLNWEEYGKKKSQFQKP